MKISIQTMHFPHATWSYLNSDDDDDDADADRRFPLNKVVSRKWMFKRTNYSSVDKLSVNSNKDEEEKNESKC